MRFDGTLSNAAIIESTIATKIPRCWFHFHADRVITLTSGSANLFDHKIGSMFGGPGMWSTQILKRMNILSKNYSTSSDPDHDISKQPHGCCEMSCWGKVDRIAKVPLFVPTRMVELCSHGKSTSRAVLCMVAVGRCLFQASLQTVARTQQP